MALDPGGLNRRERLAAHTAVLAARALKRCPPQRLRHLIGMLGKGARPSTYEEASRARAAVTNVSMLCAGPRSCLSRSIATVVLCRMRGTIPTWCVGVRVGPPFGAHAWVVAEDRDVDEPYPVGYHRALITVTPPVSQARPVAVDQRRT
ncbi:lasso peptide biosynthesis B2 protein [Actinomadura oligospora]|uniref:lasso peptide biosynthesis B2 protein n=1 Tax=Actinomadura oligospora TaxID=111804 RepID=UPI001FDEA601|nr:lasso peptide biosynthesis B2 protein [Actinomadura oligospora]